MRDWVITSTLAVCGLFAQTAGPSGTASLEGVVLNKLTGAPVKNAHVMYIKVTRVSGEAAQPISTDSDPAGHFAIQVAPGSYRLWVERAGYARQTYGSRTAQGPGSVLTLSSGQQLRDLEIKLTPFGAIAGSVFDEDGDPLRGVGIQVLRFSYTTGQQQLIAIFGASTNDLGEFRAFDLPAGRYLLLATPHSAPLSRPMETNALVPQTRELFAPLYYPGVLDTASASQISLGEGAEITGIDFRLPKVRAFTVRGRLLSPIEDLAGSDLQAVLAHNESNLPANTNRVSATVDKSSGRFEFQSIAPGSYWLVASQIHRGFLSGVLSGRVAVEVSATAPPENLTVMLTPAFQIEGRVEVEQGASKLARLTVRLASADGLAPGRWPESRVAADGSVRLAGVTPGIWDLSLDAMPEGLWIKSATYGEFDVLEGRLNVTAGPPPLLHIVLAGNGAQVSGTVTGDAAKATVVMAPASPELRRSAPMYRIASVQDQGAFVFKGVRPGTYKLFAFEDIEPFAWLDTEVMKLVESRGETVSVAEGDRVARELAVIPAETLLPPR
jgi:hypothetical protein